MRRQKLMVLLLVLATTTTTTTLAEPICKVVDGDTFHFCDGLKVRLDSIDAPEHGEPFYWESRRALADLLETRNVKVTNCHTDRTGKRQACQVFADGKDVQAEMVREGMAWDWPKYSHGRYSQQEKDAKTGKLGLWVNDQASVIHWGKRERN